MRFGFFRACAFRAKNPELLWVLSGSVNGTTKKSQVFWILVFANVTGPNVVFENFEFAVNVIET